MAFHDNLKICPKCKEPKIRADYFANVSRADGASIYCRPCTRIISNERNKRLRENKDPNADFVVDYPSLKTVIRFFAVMSIQSDKQWNGTPCWISNGSLNEDGYAVFKWRDTMITLHRFMFAWVHEPIPSFNKTGLTIDHQCRNRACFNPAHLRLLHKTKNIQLMKTHCKNGHLYNPENSYYQPSRPKARSCITCRKERDRLRWAKPSSSLLSED